MTPGRGLHMQVGMSRGDGKEEAGRGTRDLHSP